MSNIDLLHGNIMGADGSYVSEQITNIKLLKEEFK